VIQNNLTVQAVKFWNLHLRNSGISGVLREASDCFQDWLFFFVGGSISSCKGFIVLVIAPTNRILVLSF